MMDARNNSTCCRMLVCSATHLGHRLPRVGGLFLWRDNRQVAEPRGVGVQAASGASDAMARVPARFDSSSRLLPARGRAVHSTRGLNTQPLAFYPCRETEPLDGVGRLSESRTQKAAGATLRVTLCRTEGGTMANDQRCLFDSIHNECQAVPQRAHPAADAEIQRVPDAKTLEEAGRDYMRCIDRDCGSSWPNFIAGRSARTR